MARPPERPDDVFVELLRLLRRQVGGPPVSDLVKASGKRLKPSTVYDVLAGKRRKPPAWQFVLSYLEACRLLAAETGVVDPEELGSLDFWFGLHQRATNGGLVAAEPDVPGYLRPAFPQATDDVPHESLVLGPAEGDLYQVWNRAGFAYKDYDGASVDGAALTELISIPRRLSAAARSTLREATTWPAARVLSGGAVRGLLIPSVPSRFTVAREDGRRPRDMSYLLRDRERVWYEHGIRTPHPIERIALLKELVRLFGVLHQGGVRAGPVSDASVLWSLEGGPRVLMVACDEFRTPSGAVVVPAGDPPGWEAPHGEEAHWYRLAMLIGRVLAADRRARPGDDLVLPEDVPPGVAARVAACFAAAGAAEESERPDAAAWEEALDGLDGVVRAGGSIGPGTGGPRWEPPPDREPDPREVLPFYLVCDESAAMEGPAAQFLGDVVERIRQVAGADPVAAVRIRFGVVAFHHRTEEVVALGPLSELAGRPGLRGFGEADLAGAFDTLRDVIAADMDELKHAGLSPYQPAVFLLLAAEPGGARWQAAHDRLTDHSFPWRPAIVSIGLADVSPRSVEATATGTAFVAPDRESAGRALRSTGDFLARSMLETARRLGSAARRGGTLLVPETVPGLVHLTGPDVPGYRALSLARPARREPSGRRRVLPLYFVCDESEEMAGEPIDAINASVPDLWQEIGSIPALAAVTRLGVIGFSDSAEVLVPMADPAEVRAVPEFKAGGRTRFVPVLRLLAKQIAQDVERYRSTGHDVLRPTVLFVAGSEPEDDWTEAIEHLTGPRARYRPNVLVFGLGSVDSMTLHRVATLRAFIASSSLSPVDALREYAFSLVRSTVAGAGTTTAVPGFATVPADPV